MSCWKRIIAAIQIVAIVATVPAGAPSRASGMSSEKHIQNIAPAANHSPTGRNAPNCSTKRNAGMAISGCGSDDAILRRPAFRRGIHLDVMTLEIASHSGTLCRAIATAINIPKLNAGSNETPIAIPSAKL